MELTGCGNTSIPTFSPTGHHPRAKQAQSSHHCLTPSVAGLQAQETSAPRAHGRMRFTPALPWAQTSILHAAGARAHHSFIHSFVHYIAAPLQGQPSPSKGWRVEYFPAQAPCLVERVTELTQAATCWQNHPPRDMRTLTLDG